MTNEPTLLLVDDEEDFLATLVRRLKRRKLPVLTATTAEQALEVLSDEAVDVVVLDVKMPGMGGIEGLREIKRRHPLVEVVMLSGHADMSDALKGMELGAFDYLMKPVSFEELLFKVEDAAASRACNLERIRCRKAAGGR